MKRLEVIIRRHNSQMLTHHKIYLAGHTSLHNEKIYNETIRSLEEWKSQQCEEECSESSVDE
jgi:hypothetical protein